MKHTYLGIELNDKQWKFVKKIEKDRYKRNHRGYTPQGSMMDMPHTSAERYDDESMIEYGFISKRTDLTDDEIEEWVDDNTIRIYSPYDCTGQIFTRWIETHRNPNGLASFVHHMGLDV